MNGIQKAYYLDGKIRGERSFVDGKIEGTTRMYSPSGKLTAVNYYHNNFHHGTDTSFFENGNISGISSFVNGKINGRVVTFDKEGQVLNDNIYEMGKPTGIIKQYKNGKITESP